MILSIGEILADVLVLENGEEQANLGGAPFNMAVSAKRSGSKVGFIGAIGKDELAEKLKKEALLYELDYLNLQQTPFPTTIAKVTITNGERDFCFLRNNSADYQIDCKQINLQDFKELNFVNVGSLLLSEKKGLKVVKNIVKQAKKLGVKVAFDVNYRQIFKSQVLAKKRYKFLFENADVIKLSKEELDFFTGSKDMIVALNSLAKQNVLYVISLGEEGSAYYLNGTAVTVEAEKVNPIDTTGAGDAFFGAFLSQIESKPYTEEKLISALKKANVVGAQTTQFFGALPK